MDNLFQGIFWILVGIVIITLTKRKRIISFNNIKNDLINIFFTWALVVGFLMLIISK